MAQGRERRAAIGHETQHILAAGHYTAPSGKQIDLVPLRDAS